MRTSFARVLARFRRVLIGAIVIACVIALYLTVVSRGGIWG